MELLMLNSKQMINIKYVYFSEIEILKNIGLSEKNEL